MTNTNFKSWNLGSRKPISMDWAQVAEITDWEWAGKVSSKSWVWLVAKEHQEASEGLTATSGLQVPYLGGSSALKDNW